MRPLPSLLRRVASAAAPADVASLSRQLSESVAALTAGSHRLHWVVLGAPGVGKGTYASRLAKLLGVPHVSAGDLVREEIKAATPLAKQMAEVTGRGELLPDALVLELLQRRLAAGAAAGEKGVLLDGFPRTRAQAVLLDATLGGAVGLALNLTLRESVLVEKCCGRRVCSECGKGYNVADINVPATATEPAIIMPPLDPPAKCAHKMTTRPDDTQAVVLSRLAVYKAECGPVEEYYAQQRRLAGFEVRGGIPETLPRLLADVIRLVEAERARL